jgi:regulator of protease activity HflC (stomatin/prohibitin superfamily)
VKQQTSVIIERFGRFHSVRQSGLQLKIPLIDRVAGRVNLQQLDVIIETKTKDNVFVKLKVSVQFMIKETVYDAFINWNMRMTKLLLMF